MWSPVPIPHRPPRHSRFFRFSRGGGNPSCILQHHAAPSPLPLGATLVIARYIQPFNQPPPAGAVQRPPFPLQHHPSPSPLPLGASLVVARYIQPFNQPPPQGRFANRPSPSNIISLRPLSTRRGDPSRRPLHSTVQPTSPVEAVHEPPFPFQHHASPSPLPVGATLVVARYMRPCDQPPPAGAVREPPFPLQHHPSPSTLPLGASLVVARYIQPFNQPPP